MLAATVCLGCGELASYARIQLAPRYLDPDEAPPEFRVQGEYAARGAPVAAQVVALGEDRFRAVFYAGGLPGAGWDGEPARVVEGLHEAGVTRFGAPQPAVIEGGVLRLTPSPGPGGAVELARVERRSPTLGAPPPPGALVLFGGPELEEMDGSVDGRGLLVEGARTRRSFQDFRLHLEFRLPFQPSLSDQARANSGVYLQDRYEIQILDSFGLPAAKNGAGSIYGQRAPDLNMSFPPLAWQTLDIDFAAARFDDAGGKLAPARVRVLQNGVPIHDDVPIADKTGLGDPEGPEPGPIWLQDHYHPVRFRNVWVVAETPWGAPDS